VAGARVVYGHEELMMISAGGIVIRTAIETISEHAGRSTSGVRLMSLRPGDRLAAIAILEPHNDGGTEGDLLNGGSTGAEESEVAAAALPSEAGTLDGTADLEDTDTLSDEEAALLDEAQALDEDEVAALGAAASDEDEDEDEA
jgi:hypothetical protein